VLRVVVALEMQLLLLRAAVRVLAVRRIQHIAGATPSPHPPSVSKNGAVEDSCWWDVLVATSRAAGRACTHTPAQPPSPDGGGCGFPPALCLAALTLAASSQPSVSCCGLGCLIQHPRARNRLPNPAPRPASGVRDASASRTWPSRGAPMRGGHQRVGVGAAQQHGHRALRRRLRHVQLRQCIARAFLNGPVDHLEKPLGGCGAQPELSRRRLLRTKVSPRAELVAWQRGGLCGGPPSRAVLAVCDSTPCGCGSLCVLLVTP
jgi:hypothetical protein